jgi:isopenicillin-N epimerase
MLAMLTADAKHLFDFAPDTIYLNHGGYGVAPAAVREARAVKLKEIDANPTKFLSYDFSSNWKAIVANVAKRFSIRKEDMAIVDNVTDGANAVLRSFPLCEGDEILITSLTYGSISKASTYVANQRGARVSVAKISFPHPDPQQCIEAVQKAITSRTKLAILDHITSSTALILPIIEMTKICRDRGVAVLIDGAHVPGQIDFDIAAIGADWYAANLHKWYFVPRGCGFLWAAPQRQTALRPTILSWNLNEPFPFNFDWTGTRDPTTWMSIPEAFEFMDRFGERNVRQHNHALVREAIATLASAWKVSVDTPDSMLGSMGLIALPKSVPFASSEEGCRQIEQVLWASHGIVVPSPFSNRNGIWLRICAQIYNSMDDYERLARAVNVMRR